MPKGIHKRSEEWKRKMSETMKGKRHTEATKEKLRQINLGKRQSEETKKKIGLARKGKVLSKETREKLSKVLIGISQPWNAGIKHHNWQGGKSFEAYSLDWTDDLKESIRRRDNFTCQICGTHQEELEVKLDIHHINYIKKNLDPNNLVSLCRSCHMKTNYNRDYWLGFFIS